MNCKIAFTCNIEVLKKERKKSVFGGCWYYTVKHVDTGKIINTHIHPSRLTDDNF